MGLREVQREVQDVVQLGRFAIGASTCMDGASENIDGACISCLFHALAFSIKISLSACGFIDARRFC